MKIPHSLYALLIIIAPLSLNARQATRHVNEDITVSVQKKHGPWWARPSELMAADMGKTTAKGRGQWLQPDGLPA